MSSGRPRKSTALARRVSAPVSFRSKPRNASCRPPSAMGTTIRSARTPLGFARTARTLVITRPPPSPERLPRQVEHDGAGARIGEHALDQAETRRHREDQKHESRSDDGDHALYALLARARLLDVPGHVGAARRTAPARLANQIHAALRAGDSLAHRHGQRL